MKKLKFLLPLLLIPFISGCNSMYVENYDNADKYLIGSQDYSEQISELSLHWKAGTVSFIEDKEANKISLVEENDLNDDIKVHSYLNEGKLDIRFAKSGYFGSIDNTKKNLVLTYNPSLLKKVLIELTSGSFTTSSLTASESIIVDFTSGRASIDKLMTPKLNVNMTSGSFTAKEIETTDFDANLTSGSLSLKFKTVSKGDIDMTSGSVDLTLPEDGGKVHVDRTSGSFNTHRECTVDGRNYTFGSGSAEFDIDMTSGSVNIY